MRYLLDLGVATPTHVLAEERHELCKHCGVDMLVPDEGKQSISDPCREAIRGDKLDAIQLFEKYDSKSYKHINAIICAVRCDSVTVVEHLLIKYRYPLNINYRVSGIYRGYRHWTLLKEACYCRSIRSVQSLLEHGVDLNTGDRCSTHRTFNPRLYTICLRNLTYSRRH